MMWFQNETPGRETEQGVKEKKKKSEWFETYHGE